MKSKIRKNIFRLTLYFLCIFTIVSLLWAGEIKRCIVCGMDVSKYSHTKYVVRTTEGEEFVTCGVQCGLTLHLRLKEKFKSATATDLLSSRPFDAKKGSYVYKSSVITDMAPGFIEKSSSPRTSNLVQVIWSAQFRYPLASML